jgi:hypothetical protein
MQNQDSLVVQLTNLRPVDLLLRGWALYNYPERLAYSATPPDFGALLIQGLQIFPAVWQLSYNLLK